MFSSSKGPVPHEPRAPRKRRSFTTGQLFQGQRGKGLRLQAAKAHGSCPNLTADGRERLLVRTQDPVNFDEEVKLLVSAWRSKILWPGRYQQT
jgi:hypothetical protein